MRPDNTRIEASPTKISVTMQPHISSFSSDTPANITLDQINNLAKFTRVAAEAKVVKISCKQELRPGARPGYGMIISYGASFPFQYLQQMGGGSTTLCIPTVLPSFEWNGQQVAIPSKEWWNNLYPG